MAKLSKILAGFLFCALTAWGCAGGSKGTGGNGFAGTVIAKQSQQPLPGVIVTLLQTGASDITDVAGHFQFDTTIPAGSANLEVDTGKFTTDVPINNLPTTASNVTVVIQVDEENDDAEATDVTVSEDHRGDRKPTRAPTKAPGLKRPGNQNTDGAKGDSAPTPVPSTDPTPSPEATETPAPTEEGSSHQTPAPGGESVESEGHIEAIAHASITVHGVYFVVTDSTTVTNGDRKPVPFLSLIVGEKAHVTGTQQADGVYAQKIVLDN